jgi:uncharacterized protein YjbJ (UPF0337 family)
MDWDRIAGNWAWWRGRIQDRWSRLSSEQLDQVAGRRDLLVARIQENYELSGAEAERQLRNWERNLDLGNFDDTGISRTTRRC